MELPPDYKVTSYIKNKKPVWNKFMTFLTYSLYTSTYIRYCKGRLKQMQYKLLRKGLAVSIIIFFFLMVFSSSGVYIPPNISETNQTKTTLTKIRYPIAILEWNASEIEIEFIRAGLIPRLFNVGSISMGAFIITYRLKYRLVNGTIMINPILKPNISLYPGDTFEWNLLVNHKNMLGDEYCKEIALGLIIEKAS